MHLKYCPDTASITNKVQISNVFVSASQILFGSILGIFRLLSGSHYAFSVQTKNNTFKAGGTFAIFQIKFSKTRLMKSLKQARHLFSNFKIMLVPFHVALNINEEIKET